jgi:hypothetical protein
LTAAGAEVIEAGGMTLMPGLVEGHAHLSFGNAVASTDLGDLPPEEHTLLTARNAKTLLDHGFTSAYSAASVQCTTLYTIGPFIRSTCSRIRSIRLGSYSPFRAILKGLQSKSVGREPGCWIKS